MGSTSSNSPSTLELSLSLKPSYVPKTIFNLLSDLAKIENVQEKLSVLNDYLKKYEEELARVMPLRHELPQCMLLLMDAIEMMKGEITKSMKNNIIIGEEESDDRGRVDEFLKGKRTVYENDRQINISHPAWSSYQENGTKHKEIANLSPKSKSIPWVEIELDSFGMKLKAKQELEIFEKEPCSDPTWKASTRRHWTDELHAKFLLALGRLGGSKVATPKQIRKVMNVKGLTNDQVKSHLQKYRLHMRAVGRSTDEINRSYKNAVVGAQHNHSYDHTGIWVQTAQVAPEYAPDMAQISNHNDQNNVVTATTNNNSANSNFAGWLNHFGLSGGAQF